jgi:hypothetical protein
MPEPGVKPLLPLPRPVVTALYVVDLVLLAYFVYGAISGELSLPTKRAGFHALHGWAAWLASGLPLSLVALTVFSDRVRIVRHRDTAFTVVII